MFQCTFVLVSSSRRNHPLQSEPIDDILNLCIHLFLQSVVLISASFIEAILISPVRVDSSGLDFYYLFSHRAEGDGETPRGVSVCTRGIRQLVRIFSSGVFFVWMILLP